MGGEYEFSFLSTSKPFDLEKYQQFVLKLRDEYHNHPECIFFRTAEEMPAAGDNKLATFKYQCSRHKNWDYDGIEHGTWNILWNPTLDPDYNCDNIHGRCSSDTFQKVHKLIAKAFPGKFRIYDDDLAGTSYSYNYDQPLPDYTACDKECGYCGKCHY